MNLKPNLAAPVAFLLGALSIAPSFAQEAGAKLAQPVTDSIAGSVARKIENLDSTPPQTGPVETRDGEIRWSLEPSASAAAQTRKGTWNGLPNRFRINAGGFRVKAQTILKAGSGSDADEVDFEDVLKLPRIKQTFWVDGTWQVGRRHQLSLTYTQVRRKGGDLVLDEEITFDDEVFRVGAKAAADVNTSLVTGYYRFALKRDERFEIGPTLGIGYLRADVIIRASTTVGGVSNTQQVNPKKAVPIGAAGGYLNGWLSRRVVVRGDLLYIKATVSGRDLSILDSRAALDIYPSQHLGVGIQYKYDRYRTSKLDELGGKLAYQGVQVYASLVF